MYKDKTFKVRLEDYVLSFCGREYSHDNPMRMLELPKQVNRIQSVQLALHYGCDSNDHEVRESSLMASSFANALARSESLKYLHIELKLYESETMDPCGFLRLSDEKSIQSILKPFHRLRNLESVRVDIQGRCC